MRKEQFAIETGKFLACSPGLMLLTGHLTLDRGWPFPRKDSSASQAALVSCLLVLGRVPATQATLPTHPNNVRPLARSGQCLASPAALPPVPCPFPSSFTPPPCGGPLGLICACTEYCRGYLTLLLQPAAAEGWAQVPGTCTRTEWR